jgi:hypothetical protein
MYVIEIYSTFKKNDKDLSSKGILEIDYMAKKIEILKGMVFPLEFLKLTHNNQSLA